MKLLFKQRLFSWFDSYDIYDEAGNPIFTVEGKLAWGHKLEIFDSSDIPIATLQERVFAFLPKFEIWIQKQKVGEIKKKWTFFRPSFVINLYDWRVEGNFLEWDYQITNASGQLVAQIEKQIFRWTDTYVLNIQNAQDSLAVLLIALAIDAAKCSQENS